MSDVKKILLAEDEDSVRSFLSRALQRAGYDVVSCADGDSAIEALDSGPYDLLLTDIVMPGADGIEVAKRAAQIQPELKIMFITGFAAVALNAQKASPNAKVLGQVQSQPMSTLLSQALENSDNVLAEALARQTAIARGTSASFDGVSAAILQALGDMA